jgi:plastocyanin
MNQKGNVFLGLLLVIGILLFAIWYIRSPHFTGFQFGTPRIEFTQEEESQLIEEGTVHTVEISSKGFVPENLSIKRYDTVTFLNRDNVQHQPVLVSASDEIVCQGFGSPREILQNESYSFIFTKAGQCEFGDSQSSFPSGLISINELER